MSFLRTAAFRVSSAARAARPATSLRVAERQPWQRLAQRRSYASSHGEHGQAQSSEIPWIATGVAMTAGGLFFVLNQDLGHGPGHDEDHHAEAHETHGKNKGQDEPNTDDDKTGDGATKSDDTADDKKDIAKDTAKPQQKEGKVDKPDDDSKPEAGRLDAGEDVGLKGHSPSEGQKATGPGKASPDQSDKPDPRGKPKSTNEMSGKQEGLSNSDTRHSSPISNQDDKSKKGEGVAESAKLKGTVSTERPPAENKEERGKTQIDKN